MQLEFKHNTLTSLKVGKVVCVGRNYMDHIEELNNTVPSEPLLFIKPSTAVCNLEQPLYIPQDQGECHNELEVALVIGKALTNADEKTALAAISGVGLALDLTLRDKQTELKSKGYPWERAKAFDNSCPVSSIIPRSTIPDLSDLQFRLTINGKLRQHGHTKLMMNSAVSLVSHISHYFSLQPGDLVLTGTPKGVGPLFAGDEVTCELDGYISVNTKVMAK